MTNRNKRKSIKILTFITIIQATIKLHAHNMNIVQPLNRATQSVNDIFAFLIMKITK